MFGLFRKKAAEDEPLDLVFVPALVVLLLNKEKEKGARLTQSEVESIRDSAVCISMRRSLAKKMEDARGFPDIDAQHAWEDWSQRKAALARKSDV